MKQSNIRYPHKTRCNSDLNKHLLEGSPILDLPKLSKYIHDAKNQNQGLEQLLKRTDERSPFYFLQMMAQNEVYEESPYFESEIKNDTIDKLWKGTLATAEDIKFSKVKVFLMQKHINFVLDCIEVYRQMIHEHNSLAQKTHITQPIIDNELSNKIVLFQMNASLKDNSYQENNALSSLIPNDVDRHPYPYLEKAKELGIPFKELRKNYPAYRSSSQKHIDFLHFVSIYSYCFYLNHFTYRSKEDAAKFSFATREYISSIIMEESYMPYQESFYGSLLDIISDKNSEGKAKLSFEDIVICDYIYDADNNSCKIGFYFPQSYRSYTETIS